MRDKNNNNGLSKAVLRSTTKVMEMLCQRRWCGNDKGDASGDGNSNDDGSDDGSDGDGNSNDDGSDGDGRNNNNGRLVLKKTVFSVWASKLNMGLINKG